MTTIMPYSPPARDGWAMTVKRPALAAGQTAPKRRPRPSRSIRQPG